MPVFDILKGIDNGPESVTLSELLIIPSNGVEKVVFDDKGNVYDVFIVDGSCFEHFVPDERIVLRQYKVVVCGKTFVCQQIDIFMPFEGRIFKLLTRPVHIIAKECTYGYWFYLGVSPRKFSNVGLEYMGIDSEDVSSFGALYDYYAPNVKNQHLIDSLLKTVEQ